MFKLAALLLFFSPVGAFDLHVAPTNAVGLVNERLEINCTIDLVQTDQLQWTSTFYGDTAPSNLYLKTSTSEGRILDPWGDEFEKSATPHNLIIKSLQNKRAGRYNCQVTDTTIHNIQIQVLATTAVQCTRGSSGSLVEGDTPEFVCSVDVAGEDLEPEFQWYHNGKPAQGFNKPNDVTDSPAPAPERRRFSYNFTVANTDDDVPFECRVSFRYSGQGGPAVDTSNPSFTDSCTIHFPVLFGATDTKIEPDTTGEPYVIVDVGTYLNCTARGNPTVKYHWTKLQGNAFDEMVEVQNLEVTEEMVGSLMNIYNCTTYNEPNGQPSQDFASISFYAESQTGRGSRLDHSAIYFALTILLTSFKIFL